MGRYYEMLKRDLRFREGLHSCMGCGVCTGACPAAEYYDYDPRKIISIVQTRDDDRIERLMRSETIWFCGECLSCRPRCPRGNTPAYVIQALRSLSQKLGFFVDSARGRQQLVLVRTIGRTLFERGYCVVPEMVVPSDHPEQGDVWSFIYANLEEFYARFTPVYGREGRGALRKLDADTMAELHSIFEVTGAVEFMNNIERCSDGKARQMGYDSTNQTYIDKLYQTL